MSFEINGLYRFNGFELDPENRLFAADGKPVAIPSRAFDLLLYMAANAHRLLTKEELMKAVWGDAVVEEGNLTQSVFLLRKALARNQPAETSAIVTVPGRGYRFEAQVERMYLQPFLSVPLVASPPAVAGRNKIMNPSRWFILGAVVAAAAIVALILFAGSARWQRKPVSMPHPLTRNAVEDPVLSESISPDGRYLAYTDAQSITIRTLDSGETRSIPFGAGVSPVRVAWYPDGAQLVVGEQINNTRDLFVFSILTGKLSPLRQNAANPVISPDGGSILFSGPTNRELWLMDGNGENPRRIFTANAPDKLYPLFWSPDSDRVWLARVHWDKDKELITLETCDPKGESRTVVFSDNRTRAFKLLPGGRLIYAVVEGPQNFTNLWELPVNAAEGKPEGTPRRLTNWTNFYITGITATADGKHVGLLNGGWQADVYVGDLGPGGKELLNTRRLTLDESDDTPAFWAPDDKAVVFESTRNGKSQIFRQRLDQTVPELLSMDSKEDEFARFGGQWIYFHSLPLGGRLSWDQPLEIRRIPMNGGASSAVIKDVGIDLSCSLERPEICVLARLRNKRLTFYHFDHDKGEGGEIGGMDYDSRLFPRFAVSPDGLEIGVIDSRGMGNRIRRIPLGGGGHSEVEAHGRKELDSLYWDADGQGWFASSVTPENGEYLLHVDLHGASQVLFEQHGDGRDTWGIPSHGGKRLAFLQWTAPRNVWVIDDF